MERPSKETVDDALAACDRDNLSASSYSVILADEVRALRAELEVNMDSIVKLEVLPLTECISRVVEAKDKMRLGQRTCNCVEVIEAALRGGP